MFCSKCGKENNDTAKFCAYCGAELKASAVKDNTKMPSYVPETDNAKRVSGMKASDIILLVIYIIWVIPWTGIVIANYETTKIAFEWLDSKNIAMGCYMLPYVLALLIVIFGIIQVFQHKYHITLGVLAVILPVVVRIGKAVFNEVSFDTAQLIGYRVFLVYGQEWIPTLIIGGLLTVFYTPKVCGGEENFNMQSDKCGFELRKRGKCNLKYRKTVALISFTILILSGIAVYQFISTIRYGEEYLALVQNEYGKWGYINQDGKEVIPCQYDLAGSTWIDGVAMVAKKTGINESGEDTYKYGYINAKGEEVIPLKYDGASASGTSVLAVAEATGKDEYGNQILSWGFMNTKGEMITKSKYREIYYGDLPRYYTAKGSYAGELPSFYINTYDMSYYLGQEKNQTGHHIVKDEIGEDMKGVINEKGDEIIPLAIQEIVDEGEGLIAVGRENSNGDMKYGYVNYQNEIVIPLEYDYAWGFSSNGLGLVQKDEKWGYIDNEGNIVIDFQFDSAEPFEINGLAYVDEERFINEKGETAITVPEEYTIRARNIFQNRQSVFDLNGLATVRKKVGSEFKEGLVDSKWEERIACRYDYIGQFTSKGYVALDYNADPTKYYLMKYHLINSNLDLLEQEYDMAAGFGENGWSAVGTATDTLEDNQITYRCWYVDEEGNTVLKLPENYIYSSNFYSIY